MPYKRKQKGLTRWVGQVQINGKKHCQVFKTKAEAIAWEVRTRSGQGLPPRNLSPETDSTSSVSLIQWADEYLDFSQKFCQKTFVEKQTLFREFFRVVDSTLLVTELTPRHVLGYLKIQFETRKGNAANKDRKNLIAAWNWGIRYLGFPEKNPCRVDRYPEKRTPRYVPPESDFWKVYEAAEEGQDKVMLLAFLHLAARRMELFNLRWEDVDFQNRRVRLWTAKRRDGTRECDWVTITDMLHGELFKHRQKVDGPWVFPNPATNLPYVARQHWMKELCGLAGVKKFGVHAIRHLSASILDAAGVELTIIQSILRHKNSNTTARYLHSLRGVKDVVNEVFGQKRKLPGDGTSEQPILRVVK